MKKKYKKIGESARRESNSGPIDYYTVRMNLQETTVDCSAI